MGINVDFRWRHVLMYDAKIKKGIKGKNTRHSKKGHKKKKSNSGKQSFSQKESFFNSMVLPNPLIPIGPLAWSCPRQEVGEKGLIRRAIYTTKVRLISGKNGGGQGPKYSAQNIHQVMGLSLSLSLYLAHTHLGAHTATYFEFFIYTCKHAITTARTIQNGFQSYLLWKRAKNYLSFVVTGPRVAMYFPLVSNMN